MFKSRIYRRVLFAALFFVFMTAAGYAEAGPSVFRDVKKEVLPNGLTVITSTNGGPPVVSINFFVNTGSINENPEIGGISHFCEHMFYRGTGERTGAEMKKEIENLGGTFNAETSRDSTRFYVNIPSEYGLKALEIYCDALKNANYQDDQIEQEKKVILEEYNMSKDSPTVLLIDRLYDMAYSKHPYKYPIIGTAGSIKSLNRQKLMDYKTKWYSPENVVVVIVGNFKRGDYVEDIKKYLGNIPGGTPGVKPLYPEDAMPAVKESFESKDFESSYAYFVMGYRSPGFSDMDDVLAADLLTFLIGQGDGSLINREVCKKQRVAEHVGVDYITSKEPGLIIFSSQVDVSKVQELKESIISVLDKVKKGEFTEQDIKRAKNLLISNYTYGSETNAGKADSLGFYEILGSLDFAVGYTDKINRLTKEDLVKSASKYFNDNYLIYSLKPKDKNR